MSVVINLKNIEMSFGEEMILQKVNLKIAKGQSFVIIGPSGGGKSVLLKLMSGILQPTSGEVLIEGLDLQKLKQKQLDKLMQKMGMLFQKNALFDSMTVGENIGFPLKEVQLKSDQESEKIITEFLDSVGIPQAKNLFPDEISGGMQKRLGIARALALNPDIILYDDPTAGLDPITSRMIIELILRLKKENNSTIVTITNDMARAFQLADFIGFVVDKKLIITGTVEETKKHTDPRVKQFISGKLHGPLTEGS